MLSLIIALVGGIIIFFVGTALSLWISPNVTPDGHVTMPIPQLFSGIAIGILGFIILWIVSYLKLKKRQKIKTATNIV